MRRHVAVFCSIAFLGAALDLLTKHLAFQYLQPFDPEVPVIEGYFSIGRTLNEGVVFGLGQGARTLWLVVSIAAVPAILAIFLCARNPRWILTITLGLILAGTIGNMYDRVTVGAVRDFIKFFYVRSNGTQAVWPLFNLADSCICVGVFLLTVEMLFFDEKKKKKADDTPTLESPTPVDAVPGPGPAAGTE
jgi:signal peptidase II